MLRTAIIGLGWWGRTIAATLANNPTIDLVAAVDPAPNAQTDLPRLPTLDSALAEPSIDAVILCTPHTQHAAQIRAAAAARKHVFCEKPLCLTLADAEAAIAACNQAGVILGVGHERRFEPPIQQLRRLLAAGDLGTPLHMEANFSQDKFLPLPPENWRLSANEAPAGPLTATGIHLLDLCISFLGPAETAYARVRTLGSQLPNGDTFAALLGFRSGPSASLGAILATPFDGRVCLYGSQGWAEIRDKSHPEHPEGWTLTLARRGHPTSTTDFPPTSSVRANLEAFAAACRGQTPYPIPAEEKRATVAALESLIRSATTAQSETVPP